MKVYNQKAVAIWLYCGAAAIFIQIVLGGITRLTGSGLSITEWKPLLGILPPLSEKSWQESFIAYQQIAQFKLINAHFTLADYKSIFFWEWLHRNWARMLGIIFLIPFITLLAKGKISKDMRVPLSILFLLGLLQGVIGWIMVKSGLNQTAIAVSDIRLAIHFLAAILLLSYTLWFAFRVSVPKLYLQGPVRIKRTTGLLFLLIILQMGFGALMAGSKAALAAPTWPSMNGYFIPPAIYSGDTAIAYPLIVQLTHRTLALLTGILILTLYRQTSRWKNNKILSLPRKCSILLVSIQILLGILTLLNSFSSAYPVYASIHQITGLLLMINVLFIYYIAQRASAGTSFT